MYKVAICEDEAHTREQVRELCRDILNEIKVESEIALFSAAEELEAVLDAEGDPFHLLILDIELEGKSGLTLAKELYERSCETGVIFITNHREYAEEGYDAHPIHFLVKPIDRMRLTQAIKMDLKRRNLPRMVTLNYGKRVLALPTKDICYIESRNHHIYICRETGHQEIRLTLSEVEAMLGEQFQRCHSSYLVNLECVREFGKTDIVLRDGKRLPLSRTYAKHFSTAYLRFFNTYLS